MNNVDVSRHIGAASARLSAGLALALALSACSSLPGGQDPADRIGNVFAFNSLTAPPIPAVAPSDVKINCPIVDITENGASARVYAGGQSSANVRYQYSMGDLARDCTVVNNQIVMKVGIEGKVLLGPAGGPSSFTVPVRVAVRRESDEKILETKTYRASAMIEPGAAQTAFAILTDPIVVPFLSADAQDDYQIFVGFEGTGGALQAPRPRRRAARAARAASATE